MAKNQHLVAAKVRTELLSFRVDGLSFPTEEGCLSAKVVGT